MTSVVTIFVLINYLISLVIGLNKGQIKGSFTWLGVSKNEEKYYYILLLILLPFSIVFISAFTSSPYEITIIAKLVTGILHGISAVLDVALFIAPLYGLTFVIAVMTGVFLNEILNGNGSKYLLVFFLFFTILGNYIIYQGITQLFNMPDPYL